MKIYNGGSLPEKVHDENGKTFDDDVYEDTHAGFRVIGNAGEVVNKEYFDAVNKGIAKTQSKPTPPENKSENSETENK